MIIRVCFLTILFLLFNVSLFAQDDTQTTCFEPFSYKFAEFDSSDSSITKRFISEFKEKLQKESNESRGIIYVYAGKKTRISETEEIIDSLKKQFEIKDSYYNSKFLIWDGGYRATSTIELFIQPLKCSQSPNSISDFQIEDIEFAEATSENTLKKSSSDILVNLIKRTEPICPAAPRAVRACSNTVEVFVIIDQKGDVIFSKAVSGHPLLRTAGAITVKSWKFNPTKIKDKNYNVVGYISVEFQQPDENIVDY